MKIKNDAQSILIDLREQNEIDKDGMIKNSTVVRFPEINEYPTTKQKYFKR